MTARVLDGRRAAAAVLAEARRRARRLPRPPRLAIVAADDGPAASYRKAIARACASAGVEVSVHRLSPGPRAKTLGLLADLAGDPGVDALLVETPYPRGLSAADVADAIPPAKDVEAVTPEAYGRLFAAKSWAEAAELPAPCTAAALALLARASRAPLRGRRAVVIGRSATVGRPAAHLLTALDLTVTVAHKRTRGLPGLCRQADVLVAAAGVRGLVKPSWVKKGAVVLDAGVHVVRGKIAGDVAPGAAARAGRLTPPVGGVGAVTTAVLALQAVRLAGRR